MNCNFEGVCPYDNECDGCEHMVGTGRKYNRTGIPRDKYYKSEYMRQWREKKKQEEMKQSGVL